MILTAEGVAAFLGKSGNPRTIQLAEAHLPIVRGLAYGHTRGRGFEAEELPDDLASVIITATARYVANPSGTEQETVGPMSIRKQQFKGWLLAELKVLDRYRQTAF